MSVKPKRRQWMLTSLALLAISAAAAAELPEVKLGDIDRPNLSKGWGAMQTEGDVTYRLAAKGAMRTVDIPAWWPADKLRPPTGKSYVFEVRYKDTATKPVIFYSQGGLGKYWGPQEVHRFGGFADGKWKTAEVPVNADQLIRLPGRRSKTGFGLLAEADLPVAWVKLRPGRAGDEERYNAETRQWFARSQAKRRKATPVKAEPLILKQAESLGPVLAYAWPWMKALDPASHPQARQIGAAVKIRMCLNELEGGSFGVFAHGKDLTGVDYTVTDLTGPNGKLAADVIRRTAEYSVVKAGKKGYRWIPIRLWPAYKADIPKNQSHWFLLNIRSRRGVTRPGVYKGKITITCDQGQAALPLEVKVLPIDLPTMDEAGLFMGGCVKGLVPFHDFEFARDYNQNGINLWCAGVRPGMKIVKDKLVLDFEYLDEWMLGARKRGLKGVVWFLGGNPYGFPHTMTLLRELQAIDSRGLREPYTEVQWETIQADKANRNKPMPAQRELLAEWVRQVDAHAKQAGWPEIILSPFDEPVKWPQGPYKKEGHEKYKHCIGAGPWIKPYFKDMCAVIHQAAPGMRVYGSIHHINRWKM